VGPVQAQVGAGEAEAQAGAVESIAPGACGTQANRMAEEVEQEQARLRVDPVAADLEEELA
jgi:hypothetical protein